MGRFRDSQKHLNMVTPKWQLREIKNEPADGKNFFLMLNCNGKNQLTERFSFRNAKNDGKCLDFS